MGMFDTLEVHRKLPLKANDEVSAKEIRALKQGVKWKEIEFQTKSLDNCMEHLKIGVNGKLYIKRQKYKETDPKKQRGKKGKNLFDNFPLLEPDGKPWFEPAATTPTSLIFYTSVKTPLDSCVEYWVEFEAIFLEGKLHQINQLILERTPEEVEEFSEPCPPKPLCRQFFKKFIKWQEKILLGEN